MKTAKVLIKYGKVGAGDPVWWARTFAAKSDNPHMIPRPTWWKERTSFHRFSSNPHMHTCTHMYTLTQSINNSQKKRRQLKMVAHAWNLNTPQSRDYHKFKNGLGYVVRLGSSLDYE